MRCYKRCSSIWYLIGGIFHFGICSWHLLDFVVNLSWASLAYITQFEKLISWFVFQSLSCKSSKKHLFFGHLIASQNRNETLKNTNCGMKLSIKTQHSCCSENSSSMVISQVRMQSSRDDYCWAWVWPHSVDFRFEFEFNEFRSWRLEIEIGIIDLNLV